jgi:hypothetical protein
MTDKVNPFAHLMPKSTESSEKITGVGPAMSFAEFGKVLQEAAAKKQTHLLGGPAVEDGQTAIGSAVDGLHELAALNTDSLEPQTTPSTSIAVKTRQHEQKLILDSAADVRELCDRTDALIVANPQLAGPSLVTLRNYVQQLMITLKNHPEFDDVVIDHDINNVMQFIRATREEALSLRTVKVEKKAVRAVGKERKANLTSGMAEAFKAVMQGGIKK